jgi:alkylation response protein AidB-like acyl-CoA dehydrogenase
MGREDHVNQIVPSTPELDELRSAVRQLTGKYGHQYFTECATAHREPTELYEELGAAGFLGVHLPEQYGGGGGGLVELTAVIEEVSAAGCPMLMMVISPAINGSIIAEHGSAELKQAWLPGLASGTRTMAFAITEPDAGSNTHAITTTSRRDGDGYVLSGTKYWISGADQADAILVVTRDGDAGPGKYTPMTIFVVPKDTPGISMNVIEAELIQPEQQFTVFLDHVRLPASAVVGEPGQGFRAVFSGLNPERVTAAGISNGISRYALEKATQYAKDRAVWKTPIGAHQGISHPLAQCYIAVTQARLLTSRAAQMCDAGEDSAEAVNMAKYAAAEASLQTLDQAMQVHGGNGLSREYGLADLWFLARMLRTAPTSREMVLNFVASHSLGLPASY